MLYSDIRTTFCRNLLVRYKRVFSLKSSGTELNILKQISDPKYADKIAIVDSKSSITYAELDDLSTKLAASIQSQLPLNCNTIAGHNCPNKNYVISMFAAWKLGQRFLPLCPSHPKHELEYFLKDSGSGMILYSAASSIDVEIISKTDNLIASLGLPSINVNNLTKNINKSTNNNTVNASIDKTSSNTAFPSASSGGLILYTSGTTGAPKGVLHPNDNINHWIKSLTQAWQYTESDRILHFLPLHHLHGVLNKLLCVLSVGGTVDFVSKANASFLWKKLGREGKLSIDNNHKPVTLFMAVPTIYVKMVEEARKCAEVYGLKFDDLKNTLLNTDDESLLKLMTAYESKRPPSSDTISLLDLKYALRCIDDMRLMVSGSAALPEMTFKDWKTLTGHELLERYGMTEIGMALSNPYDGNYKLGTVGRPLPFVDCRIIDEQGGVVTAADSPGELRIKVCVVS